ncbi:MAG: hypothetical protein EOL97_09465 [Spirochaetia bacterium]|nr:hypothetical protein [Spirochaetia bacterium]
MQPIQVKYENVFILDLNEPFTQGVESFYIKNIKDILDKRFYANGYWVGSIEETRIVEDKLYADIIINDYILNDMIKRKTAYFRVVPRIDSTTRNKIEIDDRTEVILEDAVIFFMSAEYSIKYDATLVYKESKKE